MNPSPTPTTLDPKLKAAYDRVMSTPTPTQSGPTPITSGPVPAQPGPKPIQQPPVVPASPVQQPANPQPQYQPPPQPINTTHAVINPATSNATKPKVVVAPEKKGFGTKQVIYILVAVLFFAAYTLFWMRFFNIIQLPF